MFEYYESENVRDYDFRPPLNMPVQGHNKPKPGGGHFGPPPFGQGGGSFGPPPFGPGGGSFGPPPFGPGGGPFGPPPFGPGGGPFGPPPFGPGGGPFGPPPFGPGGGGNFGPPSAPPPKMIPSFKQSNIGVLKINSGALRPCLFRYVYLWLDTGEQFWAWLIFVGRNSAAGWRWTGFRWIYFGIDLDNINSFFCF